MTPSDLAGRSVIVTRPGPAGERLSVALAAAGAEVRHLAAIAIVAPEDPQHLDRAIAEMTRYDWIVFTSANAVDRFTARAEDGGLRLPLAVPPRLAAVGPATAAAVRSTWRMPDLVGDGSSAASLANSLEVAPGMRFLMPASDIAREELPTLLTQAGAEVDVVVAYRTVAGPGLADMSSTLATGTVDALVFASPSAVTHTVDAMRAADQAEAARQPAAICIGATTAAAARAAGFARVVAADAPTDDAIVDVLAALEVAR